MQFERTPVTDMASHMRMNWHIVRDMGSWMCNDSMILDEVVRNKLMYQRIIYDTF